MGKNIVIAILSVVIMVLVGVVLVTNYVLFSDEWLIGLAMIVISLVGGFLFVFIKLRR